MAAVFLLVCNCNCQKDTLWYGCISCNHEICYLSALTTAFLASHSIVALSFFFKQCLAPNLKIILDLWNYRVVRQWRIIQKPPETCWKHAENLRGRFILLKTYRKPDEHWRTTRYIILYSKVGLRLVNSRYQWTSSVLISRPTLLGHPVFLTQKSQ